MKSGRRLEDPASHSAQHAATSWLAHRIFSFSPHELGNDASQNNLAGTNNGSTSTGAAAALLIYVCSTLEYPHPTHVQ